MSRNPKHYCKPVPPEHFEDKPRRIGGRRPKLSLAQCEEIARRVSEARRNLPSALAREYGVSKSLILDIVAGYRPQKSP